MIAMHAVEEGEDPVGADLEHFEYYNSDERVRAYIEKDKSWAILTRTVLTDLLADLPKSGCVLDAGCGYGRDVKTFLELGYDAFGVDESSAMIAAAQAAYGEHFRQLSLQQLEKLGRQFDIVHCRNVLVHVPQEELRPSICKLFDVVRDGGALILISKEGKGISVTHTTGAARNTILHSKEEIAQTFMELGASFIEEPYTVPATSANGDRLFCVRVRKKR